MKQLSPHMLYAGLQTLVDDKPDLPPVEIKPETTPEPDNGAVFDTLRLQDGSACSMAAGWASRREGIGGRRPTAASPRPGAHC